MPGSPTSFRKSPWGKAGSITFNNKSMFLADENDSGYCGFFELGPAYYGVDKVLATCDKSKVANHFAQTPTTKNSNGNIDSAEILKVALPSLQVVP